MIHYISPFSVTKNIGKAINDAIIQLNANDEDWICHLDQDVMWLLPDSKTQLEHILNNTNCHVLGPLTNRLAQGYQLVPNMFDKFDIRDHIACATELRANYSTVKEVSCVLAGFCLCFKVSTWKTIGGFVENSLQFDSQFSIATQRKGFKKGIMAGLYVFHGYRMWSDNPKTDIKHLIQEHL